MTIHQKNVFNVAKHKDVAYVSLEQKLRFNAIDTSQLRTTFNQTINSPAVWNGLPAATGAGVTVAVLDSGVRDNHADLSGITPILVNPRATGRNDKNGHGTHVTGIIKGKNSLGRYIGVAPGANIVSLQIADDMGQSRECDLIRALQWVNQNKTAYNIRVVNMSVNGSVPTSYKTSPICAAAEVLWNRGVVVVVASGNRGSVADAVHYAPACDPFMLTVGALDEHDDALKINDTLADFSSRGTTLDGIQKPELVAPGRKIVSLLSANNSTLASQFPDRIVDSSYLRLSGTSMAAPVVAGVAALVLERFPNLTANQVKWLLTATARTFSGQVGSAGAVDVAAAMTRAALGGVLSANAGLVPNDQVVAGLNAQAGTANSYWDNSYWDNSYWDNSYWDNSYWDNSYWDNSYWDNNAWEAAEFETFAGD
jgi:serine protease AprX